MVNYICVSFIILLNILILSQCEDNTSQYKKLIIEPETKEELLYLMYNQTQFDTLVIEIYSSFCWHCMKFKPKYKSIAKSFQNETNIKFIKLSSFAYDIWDSTFNVSSYPSLYLYNQQQLLKYTGVYEIEQVTTFINKRNFKCEEIPTLNHFNTFIKDNFISNPNNNSVHKRKFILGLLKNTTTDIQHYNNMNIKYKNIINNNECFYITYNDISIIDKINN